MTILKWFPLFITVKNISAKLLGFEWLQKPYKYASFETDRFPLRITVRHICYVLFILSLFFPSRLFWRQGEMERAVSNGSVLVHHFQMFECSPGICTS